jgi:hypothetical protein
MKTTLGRTITFHHSTEVDHIDVWQRKEYNEDTIEVIVGIGKHHFAELIMTKEAWEELQDPNTEVRISCVQP